MNRRHFIQSGTVAVATMVASRPLFALIGTAPEPVPPIEDPRLKSLIARALDAARDAGATYTDVRLTYTRKRVFSMGILADESLGAGVRVLVDGCWGFASSPLWDLNEMGRLGRAAALQARASAGLAPRRVELASLPANANGHWTMPVQIDPFEVPVAEVQDFRVALALFSEEQGARSGNIMVAFERQEKAYGSSDGSYCTQRVYCTEGIGSVSVDVKGAGSLSRRLEPLTITGAGWESVCRAPLKAAIVQTVKELREDAQLPIKSMDVGRYSTVCDALSVARLASSTIGAATELNRALGHEANASGTSYIKKPFEMIGQLRIGSEQLNISANRNDPGSVATVQWDDEGVASTEYALVERGVLVDMQTTRESSAWLTEHSRIGGGTPPLHGCAKATSGLEAPLSRIPNLIIAPAQHDLGYDALIGQVENGIAFRDMDFHMDFQQSNGLGTGTVYEVKNGKRSARLTGAGLMFKATEL